MQLKYQKETFRRFKMGNGSHIKVILVVLAILTFGYQADAFAYQTGKIAGRIVEKGTGEALPSANILLVGTMIGAASDLEGYFTILNIPPGVYSVRATTIGYATQVTQSVKVSINQTTTLNFEMQQEAVAGEEIVVSATRPAVQLDVSSSQRIVTASSIESRPVDNLEEILATEVGISLTASQAGTGLIVRGGQLNETDIVVDGLSTRNERNQQANTSLSLTAIQEIELLTGGFNAEFGEIRSGLVNVITKEGSLDRYSVSFNGRLSPPDRKHFGPSPYSIDGPFWQVHAGKDAFTGIEQDKVDSGEYPFTFIGWNEVSRQFIADSDPSNDYTPQQALEIWKWQHRNRDYANNPDYIGDVTISGPVPLANATFLVSQRYEDLQLVYPMSRNNSIASSTLFKLTKRLSPTMKLSINNNFILNRGVSGSIYDDTVGMISGTREGTGYARNVFTERRFIWHDANFNPAETRQYRGGLNLNHLITSNTFYDLQVEYTRFTTKQEPIGLRNTTGVKTIGNVTLDEQPFGYVGSELGQGITEKFDILGRDLMSGGGRGQDHSEYWGISASGDLVSQVNKYNEVKLGFNFEYTDFSERREINHGETTTSRSTAPWLWAYYDHQPIKFSAYIQDKLEFQGMIANVGVRLDYLNTQTSPYNLDPNFIFENNPYTLETFQADNLGFSSLETDAGSAKTYISPRLGISHPISHSSKIFFNYGHFLQPPVIDQLFLVQPNSNGQGSALPNIRADWPRTVAYEVGLEQGISDNFLIHLTGYYKNVSDQLSQQNIVSLDSENDIITFANTSYADIRGIELRLEKRIGRWWFGWVSLEYLTNSQGLTGFRYIYEDRQLANQQRNQARQLTSPGVPSVTANLNFTTPTGFGPEALGNHILGDWRFNILHEWSEGGESLLNSDAPLREQIFVDVIDYWNTDVLVEKRVRLSGDHQLGLFMQIRNLFNYRGFVNPLNYNRYVDSLKFPHEAGEQKGNDKLGDWDKDHIDIGWNTWSQFVNPRDIFFGLRFDF
jgi:hypothetical protein